MKVYDHSLAEIYLLVALRQHQCQRPLDPAGQDPLVLHRSLSKVMLSKYYCLWQILYKKWKLEHRAGMPGYTEKSSNTQIFNLLL